MTDIRNTDDIINARDVDERIEELEDELADVLAAQEALDDAKEELDAITDLEDEELPDLKAAVGEAQKSFEAHAKEWSSELEELAELKALAEAIEHYSGDGLLINDDYFEEYARQLAEDIGAIDRNASWPLGCIDWKQAADELKTDYTAIDFDGETFWTR